MMKERGGGRSTTITQTIPGLARLDIRVTPLNPHISVPKPEKLNFPEGVVESLLPLVREVFPRRVEDNEDEAFWTELQKNARYSPTEVKALIKKRRLDKAMLASVVLHRLFHAQIETGEISKAFFDSLQTSLVTVFTVESKKK